MSRPLRMTLVGATGLVGSRLIAAAVGRSDVRITAIARREAKLPPGARMELLVADPAHWADAIAAARPEVFVCAIGTTFNAAGRDEAAFRAVDQDLVLASARAAHAAGARQAIVVSAVGADMASKGFYLRVKGEVEQALGKLRFKRLDILRPGLLRGPREGEARPAERLAMMASPLTDLLMMGGLRKYRSIPADTVAEAILALAGARIGGRFVHEHDAMLYAISQARRAAADPAGSARKR